MKGNDCLSGDGRRKHHFPTEWAATRELHRLLSKTNVSDHDRRHLRVFRCGRCRHWHLGKATKPVRTLIPCLPSRSQTPSWRASSP